MVTEFSAFRIWPLLDLLAPARRELSSTQRLIFRPQLAAAFTRPGEEETVLRYCLPREVRTLALVYDKREAWPLRVSLPLQDWEFAQRSCSRSNGRRPKPLSDSSRRRICPAGCHSYTRAGGDNLSMRAAAWPCSHRLRPLAMDWYIQIFRDNFAGHAGESNNEWAGEVLGKGQGRFDH